MVIVYGRIYRIARKQVNIYCKYYSIQIQIQMILFSMQTWTIKMVEKQEWKKETQAYLLQTLKRSHVNK